VTARRARNNLVRWGVFTARLARDEYGHLVWEFKANPPEEYDWPLISPDIKKYMANRQAVSHKRREHAKQTGSLIKGKPKLDETEYGKSIVDQTELGHSRPDREPKLDETELIKEVEEVNEEIDGTAGQSPSILEPHLEGARQTPEFKRWCIALEEKIGSKQPWNKRYTEDWLRYLDGIGLERMLELIKVKQFENVEYLLTNPDGGAGLLEKAWLRIREEEWEREKAEHARLASEVRGGPAKALDDPLVKIPPQPPDGKETDGLEVGSHEWLTERARRYVHHGAQGRAEYDKLFSDYPQEDRRRAWRDARTQ